MGLPIEHMKKAQIGMSEGVNVESTKQLDGEAKDSPVFSESNKTEQYTTPSLDKGELGGKNDQNG